MGASDKHLTSALRAVDREGLPVDALFVQVSTDIPAAAFEALAAQAVRAAPLGHRFLNVVTMPAKAERRTLPPTHDGPPARTADLLTRLAERLDTTVCWHPHDISLREEGALAHEVLARAGEPIRLCLDLGWVVRAGEDPARLLRTFAAAVRTVHVRDVADDGRWCEAVGEGRLDLEGIGEVVGSLPGIGACSVELMYEPGTRVTRSLADNALRSATAMREVFTSAAGLC